jgi:capsular polysaccharide biosynthesis protein
MSRRARLYSSVAVALVAALVVTCYGLYQVPRYETSAKVLALQKPPPSDCYQGICPIPNAPEDDTPFTAAVAKAIPTKPVARAVTKQLRLPRGSASKVLKNTNADVDAGTAFIDVTYTDSSPKRAQQITNTLAEVSSERITETSLGPHRITATLWQPATLPATPVSPNPLRNGLVAFVATLALCATAVVIRSHTQTGRR